MRKNIKDSDIRTVLKSKILKRHQNDPNSVIIDELGLNHGTSRIDIALVNGLIHGYEIKSDSDSLDRLPSQINSYCNVLDRVTLVVGYKLAGQAIKMIPEWWGVKLAEQLPNCGIKISEARVPKNNPQLDKLSVARLLWRNEALDLLREIDTVNGFQSKPKKIIYDRIVDIASIETISAKVRYQLKNRKDWRVVEQQK